MRILGFFLLSITSSLLFLFGSNTAFAVDPLCTDADGDNYYSSSTSANPCTCSSPQGCDDLDDQNIYVNPAVMEGLCTEDLNMNKKLDAGEDLDGDGIIDPLTSCPSNAPTLLTQTAWQLVSGGTTRQYANCTDYYTNWTGASQVLNDITCTRGYGIPPSTNLFYTCAYNAKAKTELVGKPAYIPQDAVSAANAIPIDNNQLPGGNEGEPSCPKGGGLVVCGRYADDPITTDIDESEPCGFCHFFLLFKRITDWIMFKIIPAVALFIVVFGGFMLVISRGNPQQSKLGKDAIVYTFIGYAVVLVGWLVLNSALAGLGVQKWTGLNSEDITIQKTYDRFIWTPKTDLNTRNPEELIGRVITISGTGNPSLDGQTRVITKVWDENDEASGPATTNCPDGDGEDLTGNPTAETTKDCIEVDVALPNVQSIPAKGKVTIGGWWQFSCGQ